MQVTKIEQILREGHSSLSSQKNLHQAYKKDNERGIVHWEKCPFCGEDF
jgi:hypothetical protein